MGRCRGTTFAAPPKTSRCTRAKLRDRSKKRATFTVYSSPGRPYIFSRTKQRAVVNTAEHYRLDVYRFQTNQMMAHRVLCGDLEALATASNVLKPRPGHGGAPDAKAAWAKAAWPGTLPRRHNFSMYMCRTRDRSKKSAGSAASSSPKRPKFFFTYQKVSRREHGRALPACCPPVPK